MEELALPQFDVFGISSGAPHGYPIGYRFPDRVRNLFVLSGIPALYDKTVLSFWPYPVNENAGIEEMKALAYELFFRQLSQANLNRNDISDSMQNDETVMARHYQNTVARVRGISRS